MESGSQKPLPLSACGEGDTGGEVNPDKLLYLVSSNPSILITENSEQLPALHKLKNEYPDFVANLP